MKIASIRIAHLNVRSLVPHVEDVRNAISGHAIDIMAVSETWLATNTQSSSLHFDSHYFLRKDYRGRGSGLGAYVSKGLKYEVVDINATFEVLCFKLLINTKVFVVCVVYRNHDIPPTRFIDDLEGLVSACLMISNYVVILGDININIYNDYLPHVRNYIDSLEELGLTQLIREPTRSLSLIDHILTTDTNPVLHSGVIQSEISDHDIIFVDINVGKPPRSPLFVSYRDFKDVDMHLFLHHLENSPLDDIYYTSNINEKVAIFNTIITSLINAHTCLKMRRITKPNNPWLTDNIKLLMSIRDDAKTKFKVTGNSADWDYYKQLRNFTNLCIKTEKKLF